MNAPDILRAVLDEAHAQAMTGKGQARHGNGLPFARQPIMQITRQVGVGFPMGQALKKIDEAGGMLMREEDAAAREELKGAIVYLAAVILGIDLFGRPAAREAPPSPVEPPHRPAGLDEQLRVARQFTGPATALCQRWHVETGADDHAGEGV